VRWLEERQAAEAPPLAKIGFLDEADRGQNGSDVVEAALNGDLRLRALVRRHIAADQRSGCVRQQDRPLQGKNNPCPLRVTSTA
jgi:hypothetical protein